MRPLQTEVDTQTLIELSRASIEDARRTVADIKRMVVRAKERIAELNWITMRQAGLARSVPRGAARRRTTDGWQRSSIASPWALHREVRRVRT